MNNELYRGVIYEKQEFNEKEKQYFRNSLLDYVHQLIDYCSGDYKDEPISIKDRLELLAFCMLSTIDGESGETGGYYLVPITNNHFTNPEYFIPEEIISNYDIAGELHSVLLN